MHLGSCVESSPSSVTGDVRTVLSAYESLRLIFEKSESDGYLTLISSALDTVIQKEITFAVCGLLTRDQENEGQVGLFGNLYPPVTKYLDLQGEPEVDSIRDE